MTITSPQAVRDRREVRKGLTAIRRQVRVCDAAATWSDLWAAAELLQHMAFDLKDLTDHGGTWAERQEVK